MKLNLKTLSQVLFSVIIFCSTNVLQAGTMYWVGGDGSWSDANHWSVNSGGDPNASIPGINDDVIFDANSGLTSGTVNVYSNTSANSLVVNDDLVFTLRSGSKNVLVFDSYVDFGSVNNNQISGQVHLLNHHQVEGYRKFEADSFIGFLNNIGKGNVDEVLQVTSVTFNVVNQTCPSDQDGQITATPNDGAGPFQYSWILQGNCSQGANLNSQTVTQVCGGEQAVLITDQSDGQVGYFTVNIGPSEIAIIINSVEIKNVTCPGGSDGAVPPRVFGGTGPYAFSWDNGSTDSVATNLVAGTYVVMVTDANGCLAPGAASGVVNEPPPVVITPLATDIPVCGGVACTEDVTFSASGGHGPPAGGFVISGINPVIAAPVVLTDICPGSSFEVATVDLLGCAQTLTHTAASPPVLTLTITEDKPVTCQGVDDGEATATAGGGTGPYTYSWLDAPFNPTTPTVIGLAAGTYTVEATDQGTLCTIISTVTITSPTPQVVVASASVNSDATCLTASNGAATASGAGGAPIYLFDWFDAPGTPSTAVVSALPIGVFNVEVKDQIGCVDTTQVTITAPVISPVVASANPTSIITCLAASNGEATGSGSGGLPGYDFNWYDVPGAPVITAVVGNLPVGTYNVGVTDQDGCADTAQVVITPQNPTPIVASILNFNPTICVGLATGDATGAGTGGNIASGGYMFNWYDVPGAPILNASVTSLPAGVFNVEVKDDDGCADTAQVTIIATPPLLTTTLNPVVQPNCDGVTCDGSITATTTGGTTNYNYEWYDAPGGPVLGQTINNICAGIYNVAVVDANGCLDTATQVFTPPMTVSLVSKTDIVCGGVCTGVINVAGAGGNGVFVYNWYDMTGTPTFNSANDSVFGVCVGTYNVEVSDGTGIGCFDTLTVTISQPPVLAVNIDRQVNNICFGECNGEIDVSASGGSPVLVALWIDSNGVAPVNPQLTSLTGLCNGTYIYEVTDATNCVTTQPITITSPQTSVGFSVSPLCPGDLVANVQALATGGNPPPTYTWLDPVTGNVNNNVQIGLLPGSYDLEIEDGLGCRDTFNLTFFVPSAISSSAVVTNALCQGICNGGIDVTIVGGTSPYNVKWYDLIGNPTTEDLASVCTGNYNMAIEDNNNCLDTLKAVNVAATVTISTISTEIQATCDGLCDGKVWVTASSGVPNYIYNWYDAPPANVLLDTASNMCVGTYSVEVTDQQGCIDTATATVSAPVVVSGSFINTVQNLCAQDCNGSTELSVSGGATPIDILWLNIPGAPITTPAVGNLCNGSYRVSATDQNGCQDLDTIEITSQSGTVTFATTNPSCGGYNDGAITATIVGAPSPPIPSLVWLNLPGPPTSVNVSNLTAGTYNLEMTDLNNCIDTFPVTLIDPFPAIDLKTDSQVVSCFGLCDGKAWATPSGGAAPLFYTWYSPVGVGTGLLPDTAVNLCVGNYFVAVVDANDCKDTATISITDPFIVSLSSDSKRPCFGVCDGKAVVAVSGEVTPFTYVWDDGPPATTDSVLNNACAGKHKVVVTNATGCSITDSITFTENTQITALVSSSKATCTNFTNGSASIIPSGGVTPFQYLWTNGAAYTSVVPNPSDLGIGKYYIVTSDSIGCSYRDSVTISEAKVVNPDAGYDAGLCEGDSITLTGTGGATYLWSTGDVTSSIRVSPLATTTYTLTVKDSICVDDDKVTITVNLNPTANVTADQEALLEGFNISTTIRGDGAGTNGTYDWNPPTGLSDPTNPTPSVSPLVNTRYYLTITDENGCKDTTSVLIRIIESIEYPDGVSPNGDGINDNWPIMFIENFPEAVVEIYNRWGQLLFHSVGYQNRWDGTFKGKVLPVGTYYFVIDLGSDLPKYTGPITIFR